MAATTLNSEQPTAADEATAAAPFRLTIAHLLLWTAATGFIVAIFPQDWLSVLRYDNDYEAILRQADRQQIFEQWSVVAVSPIYGAAVTSVAIAGTRLIQRRSGFPEQPGHWLLVQTGIGVLVASCFVAVDPDILSFPTLALHAVRREFGAVVFVLLVCLAASGIVASLAVSQPWRWRMFFRLQPVTVVAPLLAFLITISYPLPNGRVVLLWPTIWLWAISATAASSIGLCDLVRRSHYDLFHWTGLIAPAAILLHPLLTWWIAAMWL